MSSEEAERRITLPDDEQERLEAIEGWSLSSWLYWLQPAERQWRWWDALIKDDDTVIVAVEVDGWPFPWGALAWLFKGCGADSVEPEE